MTDNDTRDRLAADLYAAWKACGYPVMPFPPCVYEEYRRLAAIPTATDQGLRAAVERVSRGAFVSTRDNKAKTTAYGVPAQDMDVLRAALAAQKERP